MATFAQLKSVIEAAQQDAEKFFNQNNKAAGTRLRKSLQQVKQLAQQLRLEVSQLKAAK